MNSLRVLLAKDAIRELMCNYCRSADRMDVDLFRSVWHSDGTMDYEGTSGPDIHRLASRARTALPPIHQPLHPGRYRHSHERGVRDRPAVNMHYRGRYLDRWSLRDRRWALDHRQLVKEIVWTEPVEEGYLGEAPRRGPDDPVYGLFAG